jgi:AcrR family transcriptional regulator
MVDFGTALGCCGSRTRGRPKPISEDERRDRLIHAAEDVFLERGYGAATMDDVSRRAGMSKKTIYQLFATKQALLAALIARNTDLLITPLKADDGSRSPRAVLEDFLLQSARFMLAPRQVAMQRLMISEALRTPELAQSFQREAKSRGKCVVVEWFERQRARGTLNVEDAEEAASMLWGAIVSEPQVGLLCGYEEPPTEAMIDRRVQHGLDIFFKGTGSI